MSACGCACYAALSLLAFGVVALACALLWRAVLCAASFPFQGAVMNAANENLKPQPNLFDRVATIRRTIQATGDEVIDVHATVSGYNIVARQANGSTYNVHVSL